MTTPTSPVFIQTPATLWLAKHQLAFTLHAYDYVPHGGASHAAQCIGVAAHQLAKTLVMEDQQQQPLIILMHGDCEVSLKQLARQTKNKKVKPCLPAVAERHTGYHVGGTSPFGLRKPLPVWMQRTLLEYQDIYINAGKRGLLLNINAQQAANALHAQLVNVMRI